MDSQLQVSIELMCLMPTLFTRIHLDSLPNANVLAGWLESVQIGILISTDYFGKSPEDGENPTIFVL